MKKINKSYDVGVIIGRFQVDELHDGHIGLIQGVAGTHDRTILFLGLSPCKATINNPLDYRARQVMIEDRFPDITIQYIKDYPSDEIWSQNLDNQIEDVAGPNQTVCLYGSRDSFIQYYTGKFDCVEMDQTVFVSGAEERKRISNKIRGSRDFRHGAIWAVYNQWPKCFPTVDIAIFNDDGTKLLLGKKSNETKYRFIGGFVGPGETLETAARREIHEEAAIEISDLTYMGSFVIDDWRYRSEKDKITTALFTTTKMYGKPEAGDDIASLCWFDFNKDLLGEIVDEHHEMMLKLLGSIIKLR